MTESFRAGEIVERKLDGKIVYATSLEQVIRSEKEFTCHFIPFCLRCQATYTIPESMHVTLNCEFTRSLSDPDVFVDVGINNFFYPEIVYWFAIVAILDDQNEIDSYGRLNKRITLFGDYNYSGRLPFTTHVRERTRFGLQYYRLRLSVVIEYVRKVWSTMEMYGSQYEYTRINNFKDYFGNEEFSDILIICNNNTLPAHRIILIRQSEYFDAMITHGFREGIDAVIRLDNHNFNIIRNIVHFMYTEELIEEVDENNCYAIYESAVYFGVTGLKKYLIHYFIKSLDRDNIYTIITYIRDSDELKTAISRFVGIHDPLDYEVYHRMTDSERDMFLDFCELLDEPISFFDPFAI